MVGEHGDNQVGCVHSVALEPGIRTKIPQRDPTNPEAI
jgi:hypothetical protein